MSLEIMRVRRETGSKKATCYTWLNAVVVATKRVAGFAVLQTAVESSGIFFRNRLLGFKRHNE